jgi:hypothetical protein
MPEETRTRVEVAPAPTQSGAQLERLRSLVHFLETAVRIPGTRIRFGADAVVGLIPGVGDLAGGMLSALVITEAVRAHVPVPVIYRMFGNVAIDLLVGAVPVAGDIFDLFWKSGVRNLALLERYHTHPAKVAASAKRTLWMVSVGIGLLSGAAMGVAIYVTLTLFRWIFG